ncbi:MAG: DUF1405 domain-containing protein [Candidatus Hodarchaeales archaeon]
MVSSQSSKKDILYSFFTHPILLISLIFLNLFWGITGLFPYLPQTEGILFILWTFIPDCPLYTLLFAGFLMKHKKIAKSHQAVVWMIALSLIKFSLVAPSIFYMFPSLYHAPPIFGISLPYIYPFDYFHLFMLGEGIFLIVFFLERSNKNFFLAIGWLLLNDLVDFVFLTFPGYETTHIYIQFFFVVYSLMNLGILLIGAIFTFNLHTYFRNIVSARMNTSNVSLVASNFVKEEK